MKREKMLSEFSTVKIGDVCMLGECCREVRLGILPLTVGQEIDGWNTLSDQYEVWKVLRVEEDKYKSLVKRIQ
jgi:hypothetical protein